MYKYKNLFYFAQNRPIKPTKVNHKRKLKIRKIHERKKLLKKKLSVRSIMDPSIENIFDNLADSTTEPPAGLGTVEKLFYTY